MLKTGLCSITFRQLSAAEIIDLVSRAGIDGIEWGGDVHVPQGDPEIARDVHRRTLDAGLTVSSYGSYYKSDGSEDFAPVLETAAILMAPTIRVWAGRQGSAEADSGYREAVAGDLQRACDASVQSGFNIGLEFHNNTLTDTVDSALDLAAAVDRPNLRLYWQPPHPGTVSERLDGFRRVLPKLAHVHVFQWVTVDGQRERRPLVDGTDEWRQYLALADLDDRFDRFAILEFVRDNDPDRFLEDAATLKALLAE